MIIHFSQEVLITLLNKKNINISIKYSDFVKVFLSKSILDLLKHTYTNNYLTNLVNDKQLPFGLIYYLKIIEWEI